MLLNYGINTMIKCNDPYNYLWKNSQKYTKYYGLSHQKREGIEGRGERGKQEGGKKKASLDPTSQLLCHFSALLCNKTPQKSCLYYWLKFSLFLLFNPHQPHPLFSQNCSHQGDQRPPSY